MEAPQLSHRETASGIPALLDLGEVCFSASHSGAD
jgi:hypothetical protein